MMRGSIRKLRNDKRGGMEGLPLQLMIIVLVATLGTAVILGWMGSIGSPQYIGGVTADSQILYASGDIGIVVTVTDQDGDPVEGAVVSLTGCGIRNPDGSAANGITDADGKVTFRDMDILRNDKVRYIDVEAVKPDYGEKRTQIVVMP